MGTRERPLILLTNDDGIRSPGLWAAAEALSSIGYVVVAAPREQSTGSGRSMPITSDGTIREEEVAVGNKTWKVYAVGGTPAQAVQHGVLELAPRRPDLVVAGINYGENLSTGVSISGTVGAAMEGAALGLPALAVSLETESRFFLSHSPDIDFAAAAHFTAFFARMLLTWDGMADVDVLNVGVPSDATPVTPWRITHLSRTKYYVPVPPERASLSEPVKVGYRVEVDSHGLEPDSDVFVLRVARQVSVTPLSQDNTSRVELSVLEHRLRELPGRA
jgi:5'-nucleotidase